MTTGLPDAYITFIGAKWAKEMPSLPSVSTTSSEDEIKVRITLPRFPRDAKYVTS